MSVTSNHGLYANTDLLLLKEEVLEGDVVVREVAYRHASTRPFYIVTLLVPRGSPPRSTYTKPPIPALLEALVLPPEFQTGTGNPNNASAQWMVSSVRLPRAMRPASSTDVYADLEVSGPSECQWSRYYLTWNEAIEGVAADMRVWSAWARMAGVSLV